MPREVFLNANGVWVDNGEVAQAPPPAIDAGAMQQAGNVANMGMGAAAQQMMADDLELRRLDFIRWSEQFEAQRQARNIVPPWARAPNPEPPRIDPAQQIAGYWAGPNGPAQFPPVVNHYDADEAFFIDKSTMKTIKKKEKKVPKPTEFTEEQKAEAKVRVSVFGNTFPESTPDQWKEYDGAGWSHYTEYDRFLDCFKQCHFNHKWYAANKMSRTVGNYPISSDEIKKNGWIKCQHSDYWTTPDDVVEAHVGSKKIKISKRFIPNGDYFICGISKKVYSRNSRIQVRNSENYNYVALEEMNKTDFIKKCDVCGHYFEAAQIVQRDFGPDRRRVMSCVNCYNREMARNLIRAHNFAEYPAPIHKKITYWRGAGSWSKRTYSEVEDVGIRLFGVEVETEMSKKACQKAGIDRLSLATEVKETLGGDFVMIKEDGSLSLNGHYADGRTGTMYAGFEIVSAPADIEVHRQRWNLLEKMKHFNVLRAWDTETCGLHVHVSKDALTTLQIGRILMLMTHNNNKKFIAKVAGRGENKYCKAFHKEKFSDGIQYGEAEVRNGVEYIQASFHLPRSDDARRQAVNITNPRTIEFRIFRGTVHPRHIIRNIEFADAVCSFCHPGSRSLKELTDWHNLVHFIAENRKAYPLLAEWMESPEVELLPMRANAYGPKDTRGTKRPEVVETIASKIKPEEDGLMAVDAPARPVRLMRIGELPVDPAAEAAREARRARRAERRVAAAALAALEVPVPAEPEPANEEDDDDPPPPQADDDMDDEGPEAPW